MKEGREEGERLHTELCRQGDGFSIDAIMLVGALDENVLDRASGDGLAEAHYRR